MDVTIMQQQWQCGYDTKLYLVVRYQLLSYKECRELYYCYYSQVHSDLKWLYPLDSHEWVKYICLKIITIG